jgi:hypothetical protein
MVSVVSKESRGEDDEEREDEQMQVSEVVFRSLRGGVVLLEAGAQGDHRAGVDQQAAQNHRSGRKIVMILEKGSNVLKQQFIFVRVFYQKFPRYRGSVYFVECMMIRTRIQENI